MCWPRPMWLAGWLAGWHTLLAQISSPNRLFCRFVLFCFVAVSSSLSSPPTSSSFSLSLLFISRVSLLFWLLFSASARRRRPLLIIESFNLIEWCGCLLDCAMHLHCYLCCELVSQGEDWRRKRRSWWTSEGFCFWEERSGLCISVSAFCVYLWLICPPRSLSDCSHRLASFHSALWLWTIFCLKVAICLFFLSLRSNWVELRFFVRKVSSAYLKVFSFLFLVVNNCVFFLLSVSV